MIPRVALKVFTPAFPAGKDHILDFSRPVSPVFNHPDKYQDLPNPDRVIHRHQDSHPFLIIRILGGVVMLLVLRLVQVRSVLRRSNQVIMPEPERPVMCRLSLSIQLLRPLARQWKAVNHHRILILVLGFVVHHTLPILYRPAIKANTARRLPLGIRLHDLVDLTQRPIHLDLPDYVLPVSGGMVRLTAVLHPVPAAMVFIGIRERNLAGAQERPVLVPPLLTTWADIAC